MAVIGKIRQRSGLLIFVIGLSIVLFLLMDATNSNSGVFNQADQTVGTINGRKISRIDFERRFEQNVQTYKINRGSLGYNLTDDERVQVRNQTWEELLADDLLGNIYKNMGVTVTTTEMQEMLVGKYPHQQIASLFADPQTGQFNPQRVIDVRDNLDNDEAGVPRGTRRAWWLGVEKFVRNDRVNRKYDAMIKKGLYVPSWQSELAFKEADTRVDIEFIYMPYADVEDDQVSFEDADLKAYLNANKSEFKQEESRKIQYVQWPLVPSKSDSATVLNWIEDKKEDFVKATNDSVFVRLYSDQAFDNVYYKRDELTSAVADSFFTMDSGSVIGPYLESGFDQSAKKARGYYTLAKLVDRKLVPDSVKVSHIFFNFQNVQSVEQRDAKFALIDSIFNLIDSAREDIGPLANKFSDDPANFDPLTQGKKGGDLGWIKPDDQPKQINDALFFRGETGKTFKLITGEYSIQIMQVLDLKASQPGVQVAYLSREIIPSGDTERKIRREASLFVSANRTGEQFTATIEADENFKANTIERVMKEDYSLLGLGQARPVVRWIYENDKGQVSPIYKVEDQFISVYLEDVREEGTATVDQVRERLEVEVAKEKKAEILIKQLKSNWSESIASIADGVGKEVETATSLNFKSVSLPGVGSEEKVVALAVGMNEGALSEPIKGNAGVFVVKVTGKTTPEDLTDYSTFAKSVSSQMQSRANVGLLEALKDEASIEDNRFTFY